MTTLPAFLLLLTGCLLVTLFCTIRERDKYHSIYVHTETALKREVQKNDRIWDDVREVRELNEKLQADTAWLLKRNAELANHLNPPAMVND